jgi:hypothetical protein
LEGAKDVERFFRKNFRINTSTIKNKFNEILLSEAVTTDKISIKNAATDEMIDGKLHSMKIKLPELDGTGELRFVELAGRLYWVPFGW